MTSRYIRPKHKTLYVAYNNPKRPVLIYRDEGPWPELPPRCWAYADIIAFFHIDWNNQNVSEPYITQMTGGTISAHKLLILKLFRIIRKPSQKQKQIIEEYRFYSMLKNFDQKRIDAGWWIDNEAGLE
jgi:hypothetical protein